MQKPLLEKRRRDRINGSLDELKNLLLAIKQRDVSRLYYDCIIMKIRIFFYQHSRCEFLIAIAMLKKMFHINNS
jgi:Helix-loop-helix DNA-binding domain